MLQGTKGCRLKHKFHQQWTISLLSILLYAFNVSKSFLYSFSKGQLKVESEQYQGIWKAKSQVSRIHVKENSKRICIFVHIPMYMVLRREISMAWGTTIDTLEINLFQYAIESKCLTQKDQTSYLIPDD